MLILDRKVGLEDETLKLVRETDLNSLQATGNINSKHLEAIQMFLQLNELTDFTPMSFFVDPIRVAS